MDFNWTEAISVIHPSWMNIIGNVLDYEKENIINFLAEEAKNTLILPYNLNKDMFRSFSFDAAEFKVLILGQDPYIHKEQGNGLCFSVNRGCKPPPSLKNIWKEMASDLECGWDNMDTDWTYLKDQGVLLLNSALTVREGKSNSHADFWRNITDKIIFNICRKFSGIVYIAWGNFAKRKLCFVDKDKNLLITSGHPSPLSVRLFFGSRPFSKCNEYLGKDRAINFVAYL